MNLVDPSGEKFSISAFAAGALNSFTMGASNAIAGKLFGFDPSCADWGDGYGLGVFIGDFNPRGIIKHAIRGFAGRRLAAPKRITGFAIGRDGRRHGLHQAVARDGGRGVSPRAMLDAVKNGKREYQRERDTWKYTGADAVVVLNSRGEVVTTWARGSAGLRNHQ